MTETTRRISVRTFLVPVLFMIIHHLVLNVVSLVYMFILLAKDEAIAGLLFKNPSDSALLTKIIVENNVMTWSSLIAMVFLIPVYMVYLHYWKNRHQPLVSFERTAFGQWAGALAMMLGATGLTQLWMALLSSFDPASFLGRLFQSYLDKVALFDGRTATIALELLVTVFLVPVGEELLFRGIIQGELRRSFTPIVSVLGTTFLFAIFHLDLIQGSYVLIAGFALSSAYHFTENIAVPIAMHVLFNFVGSGWLSRLIAADEQTEMGIVIALYLFILIGAYGFYYLRRAQPSQGRVKR